MALSNKLRWAAQRIGSAAKGNRRFRCGEKIRDGLVRRKEMETKNFRCDKIAETEFARKTMVEVVVLVRELRFACVVRMVAFFVCEFGDDMLKGMHRLEQYRGQYRNQQ